MVAQQAEPASARPPLILLVGLPVLGGVLFSPRSDLLVILIPAYALFAGWALLRKSHVHYVSFVIWLWFVAAFLRRVVDYRSGTKAGALVLLAPYLASCVPFYFLVGRREKVIDNTSIPLVLMVAAVFYGVLVGLYNFSLLAVAHALALWVAPLCFALFIYQNRSEFRELFGAFERTMLQGTIVAGAYGIYQYFELPKWDALWMENVNNPTFGHPQPFEVRVFSILNGPQIMALFLAIGVLLALRSTSKLRFLAVPLGVVTLGLSLVRTAWVSCLVGLLYLVWKASSRLRLQIVTVCVLCLVAFAWSFQDPRVAFMVSQRFSSLFDMGHDNSFVVRKESYVTLLQSAVAYPFGVGIGAAGSSEDNDQDKIAGPAGMYTQNDSSFAAVMLSLGGAGDLLAAIAVLIFMARLLRLPPATLNNPAGAIKVMVIVLAGEAFCVNIVNGPNGCLAWAIIAFGLAASAPPVVAPGLRPQGIHA